MRRMERSNAHSRLTVAGASSVARRDFVSSRATRYSATRRVVIAVTGVPFPKKASKGTLRSSSSFSDRLPSLRFSARNFLDHHAERHAGQRFLRRRHSEQARRPGLSRILLRPRRIR